LCNFLFSGALISIRPIFSATSLALAASLFLAGCGGSGNGSDSSIALVGQFKTLDGKQPLVIGHRGASGYFPEHTLQAYDLSIDMGVDYIEPDLVLSKDGILISRHDITLDATTDVARCPEFAARKRAGENGDGEAVAADWFIEDFTLAEVKTFAEGIGPWKPMVLPVKCTLDTAGACRDMDGDGSFNGYADSTTQAPTSLVSDAHKLGLFVHPYTFRSNKGYYNLPFDAKGDPAVEYLQHFRAGVDGVFSDQPDHGLKGRADLLKELGIK
jgi:glycerophosphoryl diester phosphodiesterase